MDENITLGCIGKEESEVAVLKKILYDIRELCKKMDELEINIYSHSLRKVESFIEERYSEARKLLQIKLFGLIQD